MTRSIEPKKVELKIKWKEEILSSETAIKFFKTKASTYKVNWLDLVDEFEAQFGRCYLCGIELEFDTKKTHVDHVKSKKRGGQDKVNNLRFTCADCNFCKKHLDLHEFIIKCAMINKYSQITKNLTKEEVQFVLSHYWNLETKLKNKEKFGEIYLIRMSQGLDMQNQAEAGESSISKVEDILGKVKS